MGQEGSVENNLGQLGSMRFELGSTAIMLKASQDMFLWVKKGQLEYALEANEQLGYVHMGQEGSVEVDKVQIGVSCIHVGSGYSI